MTLSNTTVKETEKDGERQYVKLEKPKIVNHRIYDPNKPDVIYTNG